MVAVAPSHVGVIVNDASSVIRTLNVCVLDNGQMPVVVYSTV